MPVTHRFVSAVPDGGDPSQVRPSNWNENHNVSVDLSTEVTGTLQLSQLQTIATASFLGRNSAGTGAPEVLSEATAKTMLNLSGTNSGDVTLAGENYLSLSGQQITANAVGLGGTNVTGTLPETHGGTNQSAYTLGDTLYASASNTLSKLPGNTTSTRKFLRQTGTGTVSAAPAWDTIVAADVPGSALTKTDDTNVTLTLGGSPTTALLNAASLTLGWTGQLGLTRGGTNASLTASNGGIAYSTASSLAILGGTATANQVLLSGTSAAPAWSTATYPATTTINQLLYSSANNTIAELATANNGVLVTSSGGVPSVSSTLPNAVQTNITQLGTVTTGTYSSAIKNYYETGTTANTSTAYTIDLANGNAFKLTLTGNCTFTFSNPAASGNMSSFTLILKQDATGSRTTTWPASVKWAGGTAPTLTTTASQADVLTFITFDGGTSWLGFVGGLNFSGQ